MTQFPEDTEGAAATVDPNELLSDGLAAYENEEYSLAQRSLKAAADEFARRGDDRGRAAALSNLGASFTAAHMFSDGIATLESALSLQKTNRDLIGYTMTVCN